MTIDLYQNLSEKNRIGKKLKKITTITGTMRQELNLLEPVFVITLKENFEGYNYLYVKELKKFFFITNKELLNSNLIKLYCHVDVLETYKTEILKHNCIVGRNEKSYNLYIPDSEFVLRSDVMVFTKQFPSGFNGNSYVLAVAGS